MYFVKKITYFLLYPVQCKDLVLCRIKNKDKKKETTIEGKEIVEPPEHTVNGQTIGKGLTTSTPMPDDETMEPEHISEQIIRSEPTTFALLPESGTVELGNTSINDLCESEGSSFDEICPGLDAYESEWLRFDEIFPGLKGDEAQFEHMLTGDNGAAAWVQSSGTSNQNMPVNSPFTPSYAGDGIWESIAPPLSSESQPTFSWT